MSEALASNGAALTTAEQTDLQALKATVHRGKQSFLEVADALLQIRDRRLWRGESASFEAFCQLEFGFTRRRADQLIVAASVVQTLTVENHGSKNGSGDSETPLPTTERHIRALADIPTEHRREVWEEAVKSSPKGKAGEPKVTAAHVCRVAQKKGAVDLATASHRVPPDEPGATAPSASQTGPPWAMFEADIRATISKLRSVADDLRDALGYTTDGKHLTSPWARGYSAMGTVGAVNALVRTLENGLPEAWPGEPNGYAPASYAKIKREVGKGGARA